MSWIRSGRKVRYEAPPEMSEDELIKVFHDQVQMYLASGYMHSPENPSKIVDKDDPEKFMILDPVEFTITNSPKLDDLLDSFQRNGQGEGS